MTAPDAGQVAASDAERKDFARLQALGAMAGLCVDRIEIEDGHVYTVSRWQFSRQCDTLADLRAFLQSMGIEA